MKWKQEGGIVEGGDVGGDYQCSDSWMIRYRGEDPTRVIDVYFFGEAMTPYASEVPIGPYYNITRMTCPTILREDGPTPLSDLDDEVWSDSDYFEVRTDVRIEGEPLKTLNEMCQRIAGEHTADDIDWDGTREGWRV
jgi:hypothetical protein